MTTEPAPIDVSDKPELAEFVRQLLAAGKPRELRRGDEELGVLSPSASARLRLSRPPAVGREMSELSASCTKMPQRAVFPRERP